MNWNYCSYRTGDLFLNVIHIHMPSFLFWVSEYRYRAALAARESQKRPRRVRHDRFTFLTAAGNKHRGQRDRALANGYRMARAIILGECVLERCYVRPDDDIQLEEIASLR